MALTLEEQKELKELESLSPTKSLTVAEQAEMKYLESLAPSQEQRIIAEPVLAEEELQTRQREFLAEGIETGRIIPEEPGFLERFRADLPQVGAGFAGALAFERAGRPLTQRIPHPLAQAAARLGLATTGAFLGGAGGKGFQQFFRMNRPGARPQLLSELYTEQLIAGIEEAGSELVGRGLARGLGAIARPIGRRIVAPGAREAAKLLRESGLGITLAQATDNRIIDLMESIAEGSLIGGGKLQRLKTILIPKAIKKAVASLSDDFVTTIGKLSPEETGDILLDTLNKKNIAFKRASRSIYKQVDNLIRRSGQTGEIVNVSSLKKFAQNRLQSKVRVLRSTTGDTLLDSIMNLPDKVTFKQAASLRSALLTQTRTMSVTKDVALGATKQLAKLTDNAIEQSGRRLSGEAFDMWRFANKFHREGKEVFNSKLIKSLGKILTDNPEKAIPKIFQKGATKQIKLLKNTVDESTWDILKHGYVEALLRKGQSPTGEFVGTKFLNLLDDDILKVTFKSGEIASIKELGNAAELLQRPAAAFGATGRLVVAISQAGIFTGSAFTRRPGTAGAILFTPYAFSKIATNKKWSKLLIEGMKDPIKFSGSLTRLARIASGLDIENMIRRRQVREKQRELPSLRERLSLPSAGREALKIFD